MKKAILSLMLVATAMSVVAQDVQEPIAAVHSDRQQTVAPVKWQQLSQIAQVPEWFKNAKFGIYFHWGVYTVPEFKTEWYPRYVYFPWSDVHKHHEDTYAPISKFGYHDLVPLFKAEKFDPKAWVSLFKKAGARFAGPVAEHHDGFSMWDSECTPWNAADMGPHRDIVGEMEREVKAQGMKFITTFHHARNLQRYADTAVWRAEIEKKYPLERRRFYRSHFPYYPGTDPASNDPQLQMMYGNMPAERWHKEMWLGKLKEVIDNYDPDIIWFDSWLDEIPETYRYQFCEYYLQKAKERKKEVVIVRKQEDLPLSVSIENLENSRKNSLHPLTWETDETVSYGSWSYTKDLRIKSSKHLIHELIDIVSKNGVLLLNISPRATGEIPQDQQQVLLEMGDWLRQNGEAIYDTRSWYTYGEGPTQQPEGALKNRKQFEALQYTSQDIRFTTKGNHIYILLLGIPKVASQVKVASFTKDKLQGMRVKSISMLGSKEDIDWNLSDKGLTLSVPALPNAISVVYKATLED